MTFSTKGNAVVQPTVSASTLAQLLTQASPQTASAAFNQQGLANALRDTQDYGRGHSTSVGALIANLGADAVANANAQGSGNKLLAAVLQDAAARKATEYATVPGMTAPADPPPQAPAPAAPSTDASILGVTPLSTDSGSGSPGASPPAFGSATSDPQSALAALLRADPQSSPQSQPMSTLGGIEFGGPPTPQQAAVMSQNAQYAARGMSPDPMPPAGGWRDTLSGTGVQNDQAQPTQTSTLAPQQAAPPNPYVQGSPGFSGPADAVRPSGPAVSPADRDALIRMVYGEARGEPLAGQQATAAVALNRSIASGQPVAQVVNAHGQFEGMKTGAGLDPNSPEYQRIAAVVDPLLSGQLPDPSGGATYFYSPGAQAALGRPAPGWDDGSGRQIGSQLFFNHPFGPQSAMASNGGAQGQVQPYSVAANGFTPPPPSSAILPAPSSAPPPVQYGPGPTAQERDTINRFTSSPNPLLQQQGYAMLSAIRDRMNAPIETEQRYDPSTGTTVYVPKVAGYGQEVAVAAPQGWRAPLATGQQYGRNGVAQAVPGTAMRPLNGAERAQYGISPNDGASYVVGPDGKPQKVAEGTFQPLPANMRQAYGIAPSDRSGYAIGPDGKIVQTAADPFGPDKQVSYASTFLGLPQIKDYNQLRQFHDAAQNAAKQQGGPADLQILDMALKSNNPTLGIRPNQVEQMMSELGLPNQFKGELQSLVQNGGKLSPAARSAMMNVIDNQMNASWNAAQPLMAKAKRDAQKFGLSVDDLIPGLQAPPGAGSSGPGFGPAQPVQSAGVDAAASLAAARAAIQRNPGSRGVVIQRLQAAGINPGSL